MGIGEHNFGIGEHNFAAQTHQQLYDRIHGGPGHAAAETVDEAWNGFRAVMANAKSDLESAICAAGAVWIGAAGERFAKGSAPLVQWAEDARAAGVATHNAYSAQASYYSGAKTTMPEPVQVTSTANDDFLGIPAGLTHLVGGQTDQDVQEQQANEAKHEAVRVMNDYREGVSSAVGTLGAFAPPPQVVTQVGEQTFGQAESHEQYQPQLSDRPAVDTTSTQREQTTRPPVGSPPEITPGGDDTHTSDARPSVDAPRPTPAPTPSPTPTPVGTPYSTPIVKPNATRYGNQQPASRPAPPGRPVDRTRNPASAKGLGTPPFGGGTSRFGAQPGVPGGQPPGPGGSSGINADGPNRSATPGNPVRGAAAAAAVGGGLAGVPQRGQDEDDIEHKAAPYLEELEDVWGDEDGPRVAPPVIGDDSL